MRTDASVISNHGRTPQSDSFRSAQVSWLVCALLSALVFFAGFSIGLLAYDPPEGSTRPPITAASPGWVYFFTANSYGLLSIMSGVLTFGITALPALYIAGFTFGYGLARALQRDLSAFQVALLIAPHGVFEIPAILVGGVVGISSARLVVMYVLEIRQRFRTEMFLILSLIAVAFFLIFVGAMVEAHVTPLLLRLFVTP